MSFPQVVFRSAAVYGLLTIPPLYFLEKQISIGQPPAITHPEHYYGFLGVTLAWQVAFLVIASDPPRYRPLIPVAALEKFSYVLAIAVLWTVGRVPLVLLPFAGIDLLWGTLFLLAYARLGAAGYRARA